MPGEGDQMNLHLVDEPCLEVLGSGTPIWSPAVRRAFSSAW